MCTGYYKELATQLFIFYTEFTTTTTVSLQLDEHEVIKRTNKHSDNDNNSKAFHEPVATDSASI